MPMKKSFGCLTHLYHKLHVLCFILLSFALHSQDLVESTAYKLVLKGLLNKDVPHLGALSALKLDTHKVLFVDARETKEYNVSHIENAVHVGYDSLDLSALKDVDKKQKIVVYCSVGYRSEKVTQKLIEAGYVNAQNLYGGIFEWKNQNGAVVNGKGIETDTLHGYSKTWGIWLNNGEKVYD